MKKSLLLFFILWAVGTARTGQASEIRTDSMGGLSLAVWDDESQFTPYAIGNPEWAARAGLMWGSASIPLESSLAFWEGLYYDYSGQNVEGLTPTLGVGYEGKTLRVDGVAWFEAPSSPQGDQGAPTFTNYTIFGAGLMAQLYWDN